MVKFKALIVFAVAEKLSQAQSITNSTVFLPRLTNSTVLIHPSPCKLTTKRKLIKENSKTKEETKVTEVFWNEHLKNGYDVG